MEKSEVKKDTSLFFNKERVNKMKKIYQKLKQIKIKRREATLIIIVIIVLTLFFSGYSMGKEIVQTKIDTKTEIAKPIVVVENNPAIKITNKDNKGYYDFKVKNYNETGEISQVDIIYYIEILSQKEETIQFKLYEETEETKEIKLEQNRTENMEIEKGQKIEKLYRLEIIYDKTKSNSVEDILQDVQIKVHSEQKAL